MKPAELAAARRAADEQAHAMAELQQRLSEAIMAPSKITAFYRCAVALTEDDHGHKTIMVGTPAGERYDIVLTDDVVDDLRRRLSKVTV